MGGARKAANTRLRGQSHSERSVGAHLERLSDQRADLFLVAASAVGLRAVFKWVREGALRYGTGSGSDRVTGARSLPLNEVKLLKSDG
jgi:hypothetical protein